MRPRGILIVEDSSRFRNVVRRALSGEAYTLYEAGSVAEGISQLDNNPQVSVVLLDLSLGRGSGREILEHIRERASRYRVIILTAHEEHLAAEQAREFSVFNYLPKAVRSFTEAIRFTVKQAFLDLDKVQYPIKVFMSYTNPDFDKVTWIHRRLQDNGFVPWIDRVDIQPGYAWDKEIDRAINQCDCVLSCLSDIAVKRLSYFQRETELAVERYDKVGEPFIIPLLFDNCDMPKEFTERRIHHISYDPLHDDWWKKLVGTLRSIDLSER